ncbi:hypothetical protein [Nitratifractor sp.]
MLARKPRRKLDGKGEFYEEGILKVGITLYEKCEIPLEILYHLYKSRRLHSFSIILLHSDWKGIEEFLRREKRTTDLLIPIDEEKGIHALLCQETEVDGGVYFIKRLEGDLEKNGVSDRLGSAVVGVESTKYPIRDLLYIVLDTYIGVAEDGEKTLVYRTVR